MPYARNLPYDSYTNISFFTNAAGPAGVHPQPDKTVQSQAGAASQAQQIPTKRRLPVVIPLVVTDALEGSLSSTTTEVLRQLALGLSGTISNIGVKADSQALQDALRSISGVALNSLQTISRLGENGLRVRLGAVKSPIATDAYVMVPRTHNVTLLLLVPDEFVAGNNGIPTIEMAARSHFYDANLGSRLATFDTANSLASELADVATLYLGHVPQKKFEIPAGCRTKQYSGGDDSKPEYGKDDLLRYLIEQNQRGDIDCFGQALQQHTGIQEGGFLWNELSVLANSYGFAGTTFQLPKPPEIVPPPNQVVLLTDDGKTSTTALLRGGVSLSSERMFGSLVISDNKGNIRYELPATSISGSAPALRMTFPSLAALGITDKGAFSNGDMGVIKLWQRTDSWKRTGKDYDFAPTGTATITAGSYPVSLQKQTSPAKAGFQLETAIVAVPVKSDNTAQVSIYMTFAAATQARVTVSGAELRQASLPDSKGQPGAQMSITGGSFVVSPPGGKTDSRMEVILSLGNVIDSGTIKIAASDLNTKDAPVSEKEIKAVLMKDDQSKGAAK
jgi:hypothetical protein